MADPSRTRRRALVTTSTNINRPSDSNPSNSSSSSSSSSRPVLDPLASSSDLPAGYRNLDPYIHTTTSIFNNNPFLDAALSAALDENNFSVTSPSTALNRSVASAISVEPFPPPFSATTAQIISTSSANLTATATASTITTNSTHPLASVITGLGLTADNARRSLPNSRSPIVYYGDTSVDFPLTHRTLPFPTRHSPTVSLPQEVPPAQPDLSPNSPASAVLPPLGSGQPFVRPSASIGSTSSGTRLSQFLNRHERNLISIPELLPTTVLSTEPNTSMSNQAPLSGAMNSDMGSVMRAIAQSNTQSPSLSTTLSNHSPHFASRTHPSSLASARLVDDATSPSVTHRNAAKPPIGLLSLVPDPGPFIVPSYLRGSRFVRKLRVSYIQTYPDQPVPPFSKLQTGSSNARPRVVYNDGDLSGSDDDDADDDDQSSELDLVINDRPYIASPHCLGPLPSVRVSWPQPESGFVTKTNRPEPEAGSLLEAYRAYIHSDAFPGNRNRNINNPSQPPPTLQSPPPPIPLLPNQLSDSDKSSEVDFTADGTSASISTSPTPASSSYVVRKPNVVLRSNHPIPRQCGMYYFEVSIAVNGTECIPHVGFSDYTVPANALPGQADKSWGFNCFSGEICHSRSRITHINGHQSDTFTVGFGLNFRTAKVFLTRNASRYAEFSATGINLLRVHPVVGIQSPNGVRISFNFGQRPFIFDIDSVVAEEIRLMKTSILTSTLSTTRFPGSESDLMRHLVMQHLLQAGYPQTAEALSAEIGRDARLAITGESASISKLSSTQESHPDIRKDLIDSVLDGRIKHALSIVDSYFPTLLEKERSLRFKLRCRLFAELVAVTHSKLNPNNTNNSNGHSQIADGYDSMLDDSSEESNQDHLLELVTIGQALRADFNQVTDKELTGLLNRTLGLMAYPNPWDGPLADLLNPAGRSALADELNRAVLNHLGVPPYTALEMVVRHTDALVSILDAHGKAGVLVDGLRDIQEPHNMKGRRAGM